MGFDLESLGGGFGAGLIGTIAGILGIGRRLNRLEENKLDKAVFEERRKAVDDRLGTLVDGQKEIKVKIDDLNDFLRNGSRGR